MRFLVLVLNVGACALMLNMAHKAQANPQAGSGVCTFGTCIQGEVCCDGQFLCPTNTKFCGGPGSGSFGGKVGMCIKKGNVCFQGDQCCTGAKICKKAGKCP